MSSAKLIPVVQNRQSETAKNVSLMVENSEKICYNNFEFDRAEVRRRSRKGENMMAYFKKLLSLLTAGAMALSALPFISETPAIKASAAKDVSSLTPKEIAADMGVGWNLGNSLDSHNGTTHQKLGLGAEVLWGNPKTTQALIDAVKANGFNTIRVPVTWYPHADASYNIDKEWMARVKEVVDMCIDGDTYVIIDVHHEEDAWLKPTDANYNAASAQLAAFWKQIANEFKDYDRHLIFEGMNEPRVIGSANEWNGGEKATRDNVNKLNQVFVDTVRATGGNNKTRCLMLPTYGASSSSVAMQNFVMPNDPNILVSVHCYSPYQFAMTPGGNMADWTAYNDSVKSGLQYVFNDIQNYLLNKGYAVVIGEFGATNKGNDSARAAWADQFAEWAKKKGVPIIIWDNNVNANANGYTGECYGIMNRGTKKLYPAAEQLVSHLIDTYKKTQSEVVADPSKGDSMTIYEGDYKASGWDAGSGILFDFTIMEEGSYLAVTFDAKGTIPTLIVQDDNPWKVWAKVSPTTVKDGVAYYSYEDISRSYSAEYKTNYSKTPSPLLYNAFQMFLSAENNGSVKATKVEYIPPVKGTEPPKPAKPALKDCTITLSQREYVYDGNEHRPDVTVTYKDLTLTPDKDYTVKYEGGKEIGDGYVTITAAGDDYTGLVKIAFLIVPADITGYKLGDVNFDGKIDIIDVSMATAHVKGAKALGDSRRKAADVNEDGSITILDVAMISAHVKSVKNLPDKNIEA